MKHAGQALIAPPAGMEDIPWRYPKGQAAGIDNFQAIGVQVEKDITTLGIRPVHPREN